MAELISMTYEEARAEHFKALKDEAKRKMNYWATRVRHSRPNDLNDPAHIKASEYGAEYSYYKDALEALAAQPKWISVEERLPEAGEKVIVRGVKNGMQVGAFSGITRHEKNRRWWWKKNTILEVTHWMPIPSTEGLE